MLPTFFSTTLFVLALLQVSGAAHDDRPHRRSRLTRTHGSKARDEIDPHDLRQLEARAVSGWNYAGCVSDGGKRALLGYFTTDGANTIDKCINNCAGRGFIYAGMENGDQCYCGNELSNGLGQPQAESSCSSNCPGYRTSKCGGPYRLSLYKSGDAPEALGCYADSSSPRLLSGASTTSGMMSLTTCATFCSGKGFSYFGTEAGNQCYCSATAPSDSKLLADSRCATPCGSGDGSMCGGNWALSVYSIPAGAAVPAASPSSSSTTSTRPSSTTSVKPSSTTIVKPSSTTSLKPSSTSSVKPSSTSSSQAPTTSVKPSTTSTTPTTTTGAGCNVACTSVTSVPQPASGGGTKSLWAHHMVGNTYSYTPAIWADDINQASSAGFDGFALNHGASTWQFDQMDDAYTAADAKGAFKLFLSIDVTAIGCGSVVDAQTISSLILRYANHTSQARYQNKTLVSTFAGDNCAFGQSNTTAGWNFVRSLVRTGGQEIYLIPAIFVDTNQFSSMTWFDGVFNWDSAWPVGNNNVGPLTTASDDTWISRLGGRGYMAAISPLFFTYYGPQSWNKDWIYRSDDWLITRRFEQLASMRNKIDMAEFVTWNDYGESHYVGPIRADQPNSQGWVNDFPHTAWQSLIRYYSQGYKYGFYPKITTDQIWAWSRPHPKAANPSAPTNPRPDNWNTTDDNLYVVVMLTSASRVVITSGANTGTWSLQAGVNKLSLASSPGPIGARIERNNVLIKALDSTGQFNYTTTPVDFNYNYWVGSA